MSKAAPEEVWDMAAVAVERAQEVSGHDWDNEDKGEEVTYLLEKAGYDVMLTATRATLGRQAVEGLEAALAEAEEMMGGHCDGPDPWAEAKSLANQYLELTSG